VHEWDVWRFFTTEFGAPCVVIISPMMQHVSYARCSESGMCAPSSSVYILPCCTTVALLETRLSGIVGVVSIARRVPTLNGEIQSKTLY